MKQRQDFDLLGSPLPVGTTLIEASAGTGKTYTIAGLVLRLIIEENLTIGEILVTTYTELATAELRTRIRELIREALAFFETGIAPNEAFVPLLERHRHNPATAECLLLALQTFDEAPIYTIHGFCQRMLQDRAFESSTLFDADLITDQSQILREIVDDFWRANFYAGDPIVALFAEKNKLTPARLFADIQELTNKPTLVIKPVLGAGASRRDFTALWKEMRACWEKNVHEVRGIFTDLSWAKYTHGDPVKMAAHLVNLDDSLSAGGTVDQLDCLKIFSANKIRKNTRAGHAPRKHRLFECCDELLAAEPALVTGLEAEFLAWARAEMKQHKVQRNVLFFDDLLTRLRDSLAAENGAPLAKAIRERFPAALIDEFQDTDPVQYAIFQQIYGADGGLVFYIGDPKQAIYGFRGADVFTYLTAAKAASQEWTLGRNWRSETKLVRAINTLFDRPEAFVLDGIPFRPVEAAGKADAAALVVNGVQEPPFHLWLAPDEEPITNAEARQRLPKSVAAEIARLLNGEARLGQDPLEPRDIAVLVSTNLEAQIVQDALNDLCIPSVIYGSADVFRSREAGELEKILAAVAEPAHEQLVRAALATEALGLTGEELDELSREEREWERRLLQFQEYHQIWSERGFMQMIRNLLLEQGVRSRLLRYPDGERRLTNMLHLTELLHGLCCESRLGMTGLRKRLAEEIKTADATHVEEHELRLERDERAVRVVTIHKSKGLEFGIVFCPFSWGGGSGSAKDRHAIFHEGDDLVMDLRDSEESSRKEAAERFADNIRRLYVALTRARHRCYFVWGNFRNADLSAPAHLLGTWPSAGIEALSEDSGIVTSIIPAESANIYRPTEEAAVSLRARAFDRVLDRTYGIASFTRLITGQGKEPQSSEYDAVEAAESEVSAPALEVPQTGIFAFPRGPGPGTCLHYILEELDFQDRTNLAELVGRKLRAFSIAGFDKIICEMIEKVCAVPLSLNPPGFTLADVSRAARFTELEFYFPIEEIIRERLVDLVGDARLRFQPMSGFMKGFIDLVFRHDEKFYIVDWKSNWLGPDLHSYTQSEMAIEMERKFYKLQLSIYTVALHRFLSARLPGYAYDRHFGGAYYVFLRGIEPTEPDHGVYRTRPEANFVDQLSQLLSHGR